MDTFVLINKSTSTVFKLTLDKIIEDDNDKTKNNE